MKTTVEREHQTAIAVPNFDLDVVESTGRMMQLARNLLAYGGLDGVMNRPLMHGSGMYPHFASKASGYELTDTTGEVYVDWVNGWGSILLGHAHEQVSKAMCDQIYQGTSTALMNPVEIDVAELIVSMVPCAEKVAFGKNGSDALNAAIRIARSVTKRELILQSGFHGFHDWYTCQNPKVQGILPILREYVQSFEYNNLESLQHIFDERGEQIAAIVMEPVNMYMPEAGYLTAVAEMARQNGTILIWDEVVTAFRLGKGGAQDFFQMEPDLAVLGKGMANGMPLSAVVGRSDLMQHLPRTAYGMTYRGEAVSLAAAKACLGIVRDQDVSGHLERIGSRLRKQFHNLCSKYDIHCELLGPAARMTFVFQPQGHLNWDQLRSMFVLKCLENRVLTNGNVMVSYAHDECAIERTLVAYEVGLKYLRQQLDQNAEQGRGNDFAHDASSIQIRGCVDTIDSNESELKMSGWCIVDGSVPSEVRAELLDGQHVQAAVNLRPDLANAFPDVVDAEQAGFSLSLPRRKLDEPRRFRIVVTVGDIERYYCLVVEESVAMNPLQKPLWFRDGILVI